jgi:hypothetical protein|tara:strand:+ start:36 stop:593 length:558 start_codon:yes stop_codon:yes gene_type:complete
MALPSSGQITLDQIHVEAGGTSGTQAGLNDSDIRGLIGASSGAAIDFADFYGVSAFSATHTLTQALYDSSANYYGKFIAGSISPTTFNGYTILYVFRLLTDGSASTTSSFWFYLDGSSVPENTLSNIKIECDDGTIISLDKADASTSQGASSRWYTWNNSDMTSSEHSSFVSTFDGSGTIDLDIS